MSKYAIVDIKRHLIEGLIFLVVLVILGISTVILAEFMIIDWQQATSMLWVEVAVGIVLFLYRLLWRGKEAERKHELEQKAKQRTIHCKNLLTVYQIWATSYTSPYGRYSYGSTHFGIHTAKIPTEESYYPEAKEHLKGYRQINDLLKKAETLIAEANSKGQSIEAEIEKEVKQIMAQHDLKEWNQGGRKASRWYYANMTIPSLIVKPIAEGSRYRKPRIQFEQKETKRVGERGNVTRLVPKRGVIRSPEEGAEFAGEFDSEEAEILIPVFESLPTELSPKLRGKVTSLQDDLKKAAKAYDDFVTNLKECVIKPLENDFAVQGNCHLCPL